MYLAEVIEKLKEPDRTIMNEVSIELMLQDRTSLETPQVTCNEGFTSLPGGKPQNSRSSGKGEAPRVPHMPDPSKISPKKEQEKQCRTEKEHISNLPLVSLELD